MNGQVHWYRGGHQAHATARDPKALISSWYLVLIFPFFVCLRMGTADIYIQVCMAGSWYSPRARWHKSVVIVILISQGVQNPHRRHCYALQFYSHLKRTTSDSMMKKSKRFNRFGHSSKSEAHEQVFKLPQPPSGWAPPQKWGQHRVLMPALTRSKMPAMHAQV